MQSINRLKMSYRASALIPYSRITWYLVSGAWWVFKQLSPDQKWPQVKIFTDRSDITSSETWANTLLPKVNVPEWSEDTKFTSTKNNTSSWHQQGDGHYVFRCKIPGTQHNTTQLMLITTVMPLKRYLKPVLGKKWPGLLSKVHFLHNTTCLQTVNMIVNTLTEVE